MTTWLDGTITTRAASVLEGLLRRGANVKEPGYGAIGNGIATDTAAITAALGAAAAGTGVCFLPPGTFKADVTIPDGVMVIGSSISQTWLKGSVTIGSNVVIRDIKLGDTGVRTLFGATTTNVLVDHCWLFGGNSIANIYMLDAAISNVHFVDCEISGNTSGGNGVLIADKGYAATHVEDISFTRCWFHANDRMNFECISSNDATPVVMGWRNIKLIDCVLDKAPGATGIQLNVSFDGTTVLAAGGRASGHSIVRGCHITGGVYGLELAGPIGMLVEGNTIRNTENFLLSMSGYAATDFANTRILGNEFTSTLIRDVVIAGCATKFIGNHVETAGCLRPSVCNSSVISGNTVVTTGTSAVILEHCANNIFTDNHIHGGTDQCVLFIYSETIRNLVDGNYLYFTNGGFDFASGAGVQDFGKNIASVFGVVNDYERSQLWYPPLTYSTSITPNVESIIQQITITNATAFTINVPPLGGYFLTFEIFNNTAGAHGTITMDNIYLLAGGGHTLPATPAGKHLAISFYWSGANWIETNRAVAVG